MCIRDRPLTEVADASPADAMKALDAAAAAQKSWAATPARERSEILRAAFEKVTERADDIALLMTLEMGKPLKEAQGEVVYGGEFLRWFSEEAVRHYGRYAVSYTHLDVYKRQARGTPGPGSGAAAHPPGPAPSPPPGTTPPPHLCRRGGCLLYTSRCV